MITTIRLIVVLLINSDLDEKQLLKKAQEAYTKLDNL